MARLDEDAPWLINLPTRDKALLADVLRKGVTSFSVWFLSGCAPGLGNANFFGAAPGHLARSVTLQQTLQLIRITIDTVEQEVPNLRLPGDDRDVREAALRYARDVAFAAAEVYAQAAEVRGAWDARLEALLVDALLRPDAADTIDSLVSALGWREHSSAIVLTAAAPATSPGDRIAGFRRAAAAAGFDCLVGLHSGMLLAVLAGDQDPSAHVSSVLDWVEPGPVVLSPVVATMVAAGPAARSARSGWLVAAAWPGAPRPCSAHELLPERLLAGDTTARQLLIDQIFTPLQSDPVVLETAQNYLENGRSLEAAARALFVHPNTIRYRLRKVSELTGWDPTNQREGYVVQLGLTVGMIKHLNL